MQIAMTIAMTIVMAGDDTLHDAITESHHYTHRVRMATDSVGS